MSPSPGKSGISSSGPTTPPYNQGYATLIVMIAVLTIIILFCCFAAPGIRDLCKRYVLRSCVIDDPAEDNASTAGESATPTIILLPYGQMLVVDRTVFAQLHADRSGIDFMELSANLIRARQYQSASNPSILDSEATSKGLSPISLGLSPPAYDDIFGDKTSDLPPSYSELSFLFRTRSIRENIEMFGSTDESNFNNENNLNKELDDEIQHSDINSVHIDIEVDSSRPQHQNSNKNNCSLNESSF